MRRLLAALRFPFFEEDTWNGQPANADIVIRENAAKLVPRPLYARRPPIDIKGLRKGRIVAVWPGIAALPTPIPMMLQTVRARYD